MRQKLLTTAALILLAGAAIFVTNPARSPEPVVAASSPVPAAQAGLVPEVAVDMSPPETADPVDLPANQLGRLREIEIGRAETFYDALRAHGVAHDDVMGLVRAVKPFRDLGTVRVGELFRIELDDAGRLEALAFDFEVESWVRYERQGVGFAQEMGSYPVERRVCGVSGAIRSNLYDSLAESDVPADLVAKMTDVLGWDIDFERDLRRGDTFRVIYEEVWKDGEFVRTGPILACTLVNGGRPVSVYQFTAADGTPGYFDPAGKSLQKGLIRAPLNYSRISSNFSYSRLHPVHKRVMPHLGIDYAAPVGTPVWAAGDGVIAEIGSKTGNGRYICIKHDNRDYETYYLHFSKFAGGMKKGRRVRQGEVIGYVGASGYATGPHLDFRIKQKGRFVDPRKVKLPAGAPIPAPEMEFFSSQRELLAWAMDELPAVCTAPQVLPALAPASVPNWNAEAYAASSIPATVRANAIE